MSLQVVPKWHNIAPYMALCPLADKCSLYYTIRYYTLLYSTLLYSTLLYSTILYYTILYYTMLYYALLHVDSKYPGPSSRGPGLPQVVEPLADERPGFGKLDKALVA